MEVHGSEYVFRTASGSVEKGTAKILEGCKTFRQNQNKEPVGRSRF